MLVSSFIVKDNEIIETLSGGSYEGSELLRLEEFISPVIRSFIESEKHYETMNAVLPGGNGAVISLFQLPDEGKMLLTLSEEEDSGEVLKHLNSINNQKECYANLLTTTLKDSISVIDGYLQLLQEEKSDLEISLPAMKEEINKILENCDMIDCISKLQGLTTGFDRRGTDLKTLFEYVIVELKPKIEKKKIAIMIKCNDRWGISFNIRLFKRAFTYLTDDIIYGMPDRGKLSININSDCVEIDGPCDDKFKRNTIIRQKDPLKDLSNPFLALKKFVVAKIFEVHGLEYEILPIKKGVKHRIGC